MTEPPKSKQAGSKQDGPPPRRGWAGAVGREARLAAAAGFQRAGFADPALVLGWREIAGAEVARLCRPTRFSPRDGTLTLLAEPGAALFLSHEGRTLCAHINAYLGHPLVQRLKFVQGRLAMPPAPEPPPRPPAEPDSSDPANGYLGTPEMKAALLRLARWRAGRGN